MTGRSGLFVHDIAQHFSFFFLPQFLIGLLMGAVDGEEGSREYIGERGIQEKESTSENKEYPKE